MSEYSNIIGEVGEEPQVASAQAVGNVDANPDQAARAIQLGAATGVNPSIVYGDLEGFERQHKATLAADIVRSNSFISDYVNSSHLASAISNDDYGQLDAVSQATQKIGKRSILGAAWEGFKHGAGEGPVGDWIFRGPGGLDFVQNYRMSAAILSVLGSPIEVPLRVVGGGIQAITEGAGQAYEQITGDPKGREYGRQFGEFIQDPGVLASIGLPAPAGPKMMDILARNRELRRAVNEVGPYVHAGKEPPAGLYPEIDAIKADQAKLDLDNLNEALKEASGSLTRERSPEMFADFIRQHTDAEVGISADAVAKLYGEKKPSPDDGLLGWVPKISEQLESALATGGDIRVPIADLLAKADPKVIKDLGESIRVRKEGLTLEEVGRLEETSVIERGVRETIEDTIRSTAKLDPLAAEPKITIQRVEQEFQLPKTEKPAHAFALLDHTGKDVGTMYIAEEAGGKRLYVDDITATDGVRALGPTAIRDVLEQLKKEFPNAETLEGMRVSGARVRQGDVEPKALKAKIDLKKVKPRKPKQLELDVTRLEDKDAFEKAAAIGMTVDQYKRYQRLIERRIAEDAQYYEKKALEEARKRQTAEWKASEAEIRGDVVKEVNARPDVAADNFLRDGTLYGEKIEPKPRIDEAFLTEEQKAALPKSYYGAKGMHPDDMANLFGYENAQAMLTHLQTFVEDRKASGMRPEDYKRRLISAEIDRQMEAKHGRLSENILEEAKERVLSETQLELLHEEVLALALQADAEFSITKDQLKKWVQEKIEGMPLSAVDSDRFLADAGKAGREAELSLLKADPVEAFRQKQRQYLAISMAKEAKAIEKAQTSFERTAKRFRERQVKSVEQEFTNFIHALLVKAGLPVKRSVQEIGESIAADGFTSLDSFVTSKVADGWELAVPDYIGVGELKQVPDMSVREFLEFKDAIDSLAHVGREVRKVEVAGQKMEFQVFKDEVLANIRALPVRPKDKPARWAFRYDAEIARMEEIVKDLDLRKELGPLFKAVIQPMMDAKAYENKLLEKLSERLADTKGFGKDWQKKLGDTIPQDFFFDPFDGTLFDLTREHMLQIMLNFGNRSNIKKFTEGYVGKEKAAEFETKLWGLIHQHATKEDWQFVQKMWDTFDEWKAEANRLYRNLSGVAPKWIESVPIQTPHGEFRGGYYPIIWDKLRSNVNVIENRNKPATGTFGQNYLPATVSNRYTKERTGYVDRIQFQTSIEQVAGRMQQMIHDIAYREAVINASKVIYDKEIRGAIRKHYGTEYEAQLHPWLRDIANHFNQSEQSVGFANAILRRARFNLMAHALGLNLKVILSPDLAVFNPKDIATTLWNRRENVDIAWQHSKEIPHTIRNMDRDFREKLEQTISSKGWEGVQADAVRWAFLPMAKLSQGLRVVTFTTEYKKAVAKGLSESDAVALADSAVRERHGSSGLPDMPAIMRSNEAMKMATTFYGFFNTMYNWQRQIPGQARRHEYKNAMQTLYGAVIIPSVFGALLFNKHDKDESWFGTIFKALILQPAQTMVFAREFANYFFEGYPPRTPLESIMTAAGSMYGDVKRAVKGEPMKKPVQNIANVVGLGAGLPLGQIGRTGQFAYDVQTGKQRPRNILEWARGIIFGEAVQKR